MEQVISRPIAQPINFSSCGFDNRAIEPQELDDDLIMQELFAIRSLEHQVKRSLANTRGKADESLYLKMTELNARVARFETMLDQSDPISPKPAAKALRRAS